MKIIIDEIYDKKLIRQQLTDALHKGEVIVEFKKVNGELRSMPCTLRSDLLPPAPKLVEPAPARKHSDATVSVWCTDKQAWRSFRIDSVISFDPLTAE